MDLLIRPASAADAAAVARIYNHYVAATCVTFETDAVAEADMVQRIAETASARLPWLVAERDGSVLGYAYASKWKGRCAYRYSVESTVYLDPAATGNGAGRRLYSALIEAIRGCGMHAVIGGIALPNEASVRLHERLGFRQAGRFAQVGWKQERWVDVGYWQLLL
ncbi:GNAT family N-acetyltransferase [Luteimonas sp. RD2P54]|uniref:GNAT family N-acetyltransferase n=1 Tax=Luteimonas endophytica TaxID=3042023 RepID=A0ABT6J908_9GAMM|nr:arsinothricin resistance N-acetyltransferase ArsN1 family B [Luteimonas endophytica]MDH5823291.1 GNAT family N-acetyltransferase [Luteimonas endophytica]